MEILSLSNVFPLRLEAKDENGNYTQVVFVDILAKKVYNASGYPAFEELWPEILGRINKPQTVVIPQSVRDAMQKQRAKDEQVVSAAKNKEEHTNRAEQDRTVGKNRETTCQNP